MVGERGADEGVSGGEGGIGLLKGVQCLWVWAGVVKSGRLGRSVGVSRGSASGNHGDLLVTNICTNLFLIIVINYVNPTWADDLPVLNINNSPSGT